MIFPIHVLKRIPLFASLPDEDLQPLEKMLRRERLQKGGVLFRQGDIGTALYLILQGRIKICLSRQSGTVTLAILGQGEFLGEMAILDGLPRSADAIALEDSYLYALNRSDFLAFMAHNEKAVQAVLASISLRLRRTDKLLAEMCFLNLTVRIVSKLVEMAEAQEPEAPNSGDYRLKISQQELGDTLGVSRESINKELKRLRDQGLVSTSRSTIRIHHLADLKRSQPSLSAAL